jgi:Glycosyl transferase family 2
VSLSRDPTVSVVCPVYNRSVALMPTLASVLAQQFADLELLVGSDGSTDDSDEVVRELARSDRRVSLTVMPRRGDPGLVRAALCGKARGAIVAYIDHDDRWDPDHLSHVVARVSSSCPVVVTGARYEALDEPERVLRGDCLVWHPDLAVLDPYAEPTRVAHVREALQVSGGWQRAPLGYEDWDLWWRMSRQGIAFQPIPVTTAHVTVEPTSRRHSVAARCVLVLAESETAEDAVAAAEAWGRSGAPEVVAESFAEFGKFLEADGSTRFGSSVPPPASRVPELWPAESFAEGLGAIRVTTGGRTGVLLCVSAPVVARRHAQQVAAVFVRRFGPVLQEMTRFLAAQRGVRLVTQG